MLSTTRLEVEKEAELNTGGCLEAYHPRTSKGKEIGARGGTRKLLVVEEEGAVAIPLASVPATVELGISTVGRERGEEWC